MGTKLALSQLNATACDLFSLRYHVFANIRRSDASEEHHPRRARVYVSVIYVCVCLCEYVYACLSLVFPTCLLLAILLFFLFIFRHNTLFLESCSLLVVSPQPIPFWS